MVTSLAEAPFVTHDQEDPQRSGASALVALGTVPSTHGHDGDRWTARRARARESRTTRLRARS
jgi:hypothetical protein